MSQMEFSLVFFIAPRAHCPSRNQVTADAELRSGPRRGFEDSYGAKDLRQ